MFPQSGVLWEFVISLCLLWCLLLLFLLLLFQLLPIAPPPAPSPAPPLLTHLLRCLLMMTTVIDLWGRLCFPRGGSSQNLLFHYVCCVASSFSSSSSCSSSCPLLLLLLLLQLLPFLPSLLLTWSLSLLQKGSTCFQNLQHARFTYWHGVFFSCKRAPLVFKICSMQDWLLTWSLSLLHKFRTPLVRNRELTRHKSFLDIKKFVLQSAKYNLSWHNDEVRPPLPFPPCPPPSPPPLLPPPPKAFLFCSRILSKAFTLLCACSSSSSCSSSCPLLLLLLHQLPPFLHICIVAFWSWPQLLICEGYCVSTHLQKQSPAQNHQGAAPKTPQNVGCQQWLPQPFPQNCCFIGVVIIAVRVVAVAVCSSLLIPTTMLDA